MSTTETTGIVIDQAALAAHLAGSVSFDENEVHLLSSNGDTLKSISFTKSRNWILSKYNWSGVVRLGKAIAERASGITYITPGQLSGTAADDQVLLPDGLLAALIHHQYQRYKSTSSTDGLPGSGTLKSVYDHSQGMIAFMNQTQAAQSDPISLSVNIFDAEVLAQQADLVYDEVRAVIRRRNGLFSDLELVPNVVGFRFWEGSNFSNSRGSRIRMNDHFMVFYLENGIKKVHWAQGTTDPGQLNSDGHLLSDQTITLRPGWHQSYQAAGRTGNVLRKQGTSGSITFVTDTGMNFHKANSIHRMRAYNRTDKMKSSSKAQVHTNTLGSQTEHEVYALISKLQRTLIGYGQKWGHLTVEQQSTIQHLLGDLKSTLGQYDLYQGYAKSGSIGVADYMAMVEGWIESSDWSSDPNYGHVTEAFSDGCQVFENTQVYAEFMWAWQQFAYADAPEQRTSQNRWYYNLLDASSLNLPQ